MRSTSEYKALVLCAPRGGRQDGSVPREALLHYLRSGTYVGLEPFEHLDTWTDGEWLWDAADVYMMTELEWVPTGTEFVTKVHEFGTAPGVVDSDLDDLASRFRIRRAAVPAGTAWVPVGESGRSLR